MAKVSPAKVEAVKRLKEALKQHPVVGVADLMGVTAAQLQRIRANLAGKVFFAMSKKTLMRIALKEAEGDKPGVSKLTSYFQGMPCLVLSNESPFKLARHIESNKTTAPAKAGQIAPKDIVIEPGPTGFTPGPIIGELGAAGIKSGVENGKIVIKSEAVVAKKGEPIKPNIASLLLRLGIQPMTVGIKLRAVYEAGEILEEDVLLVDDKALMAQLRQAVSEGIGLSLAVGYPTKESITLLIQKAGQGAISLATECGYVTSETATIILAKAELQSMALNEKLNLKEG